MKKLIALIMLAVAVPGAGRSATTNTLVDHTDTAPAWHSYLVELDGSLASFEIAGSVVRFPPALSICGAVTPR